MVCDLVLRNVANKRDSVTSSEVGHGEQMSYYLLITAWNLCGILVDLPLVFVFLYFIFVKIARSDVYIALGLRRI